MSNWRNWKRRFDQKLGIEVWDAPKEDFYGIIRSLHVEHYELPDDRGVAIGHILIVIGHHHFVNIEVEQDMNKQQRVLFEVGSTHHGAKFCASLVSGDLDEAIDLLRKSFPKNVTDSFPNNVTD